MRPMIPAEDMGSGITLIPMLVVISLCIFLVLNTSSSEVTTNKTISGWVTYVSDDSRYVTVQETKPTRIVYNPKFGPVNTPPAASIHRMFVEESARPNLKVGTRVSTQASCVSKNTIANFGENCAVKEVLQLEEKKQ